MRYVTSINPSDNSKIMLYQDENNSKKTSTIILEDEDNDGAYDFFTINESDSYGCPLKSTFHKSGYDKAIYYYLYNEYQDEVGYCIMFDSNKDGIIDNKDTKELEIEMPEYDTGVYYNEELGYLPIDNL